jgi:murein DD-endopeptidase MepM/ murein hydrolase activator NlpD
MVRFRKLVPMLGFGLGISFLFTLSLFGGAGPGSASAAEASVVTSPEEATTSGTKAGGIVIQPDPEIKDAYCVKLCVSRHKATPGSIVRLTGAHLDDVKRVVFPGKKKRMKVRYRARSSVAVRVVVPKGADDGHPFVVDASGARSNRSPKKLAIVSRRRIPREAFPIRGPFDYLGGGGRFGAARSGYSHQGQDISAACGTKLVVVKRARVIYNQYQGAAGNYVVFNNKGDNTYFAFMHMLKPSKLRVGEKVKAGDTVGRVGNTGRSYGCHLHFEYWIGPWQTGGRPIDPLPYLKSLD